MPRTSRKTLTFPKGGVDRQGVYRRQTRPFSSPWSVNVRVTGPLEVRDRGGSRPGLTKVSSTDLGAITAIVPLTYIDASDDRIHSLIVIGDGAFYDVQGATATETDADLLLEDGINVILAEDGSTIVFNSTVAEANPIGDTDAYSAAERGGKLYLADSVLRVYDPVSGVVDPVLATAGTVPTAQPLICLYRDRIVLAGDDHVWYASRQGDPGDWDFGADMGDVGKAVAAQVGDAGQIGDVITSVIPLQDAALVFGSANGLWVMRGDPATGQMEEVSGENGIIAPQAWAVSPDGLLAFLSNDGVYLWSAGSRQAPTRFSEERTPGELRNVDTSSTITMAYDAVGRGFHLSITPAAGDGEHWWLDPEYKAVWPVVFQPEHQPTASASLKGDGLSRVVLGGRDGFLREFDETSGTDDATAVESHLLVGPIHMAASDVTDSLVAELHGLMADLPGTVTWRLVMGNSAEEATDTAVAGVLAAIAGTTITGVAASGTWAGGRNKVERPRARGAWAVVWIEGGGRWAYEAVATVARQFGRIR